MLYDYVVIGSGAGGSAAAWRLAQTGCRVLVLERGERLPTDGSTLNVTRVLRRKAFISRELWNTRRGLTKLPREYNNIGGKTKWSGGALVRFQRSEFDADVSHRGFPWPIDFTELEIYYSEVERLLRVLTFDIEPDLERLLAQLVRRDPAWSQHPLPLGLAPDIAKYPDELNRFDGGFASPRGLKSDAESCLLDRLRGFGHVSIVAGKEAVVLEPVEGRTNRIGAVRCSDGSRYKGAVFLLAAGALHSPRLLERYARQTKSLVASSTFEHVGRYYKHHLNSTLLALSAQPITDRLRKTVIMFHSACRHSSVQTVGPIDGEVLNVRLRNRLPQAVANALASRAYGFWLSTEDGSVPENRVIDADGVGCSILDYDVARLPEARAEHERLRRMLRTQLFRLGFVAIAKASPAENTGYACGTLVAGNSPQTSVVNAEGRVHAIDNLYVVDGSALPRSGRVNPALTIYAWALRVAELLCRRRASAQALL